MTAAPEPRRPGSGREITRSIGQVLTALSHDFPDISISKIRFLESEGLITPQRAPSGYRRYAEHDVERLRYVLSVQREHYLPLKVIREHLEMMDRGQAPPEPKTLESGSTATTTTGAPVVAAPTAPPAAPKKALRLSRQDLLEASGLTEAGLVELERTGIVVPRRGRSEERR